MPWQAMDILLALPVFALILLRITGLILTAPLLNSQVIPGRVKIALAMTMALMLFPIVRSQAPVDMTLADILAGSMYELAIGMTIGLGLALMFSGVEVGGLMVGQQAGIALGRVFNPTQNQQTTLTGQLYSIVLTLTFLIVGGHRAMVVALLDTFKSTPMLTRSFESSSVLMLAEILTSAFVLAIRLAAPVLIALVMTSLAMGFLSRTMPQLNILSVGFQIRIIAAMTVAALSIGAAENLMVDAVWSGLEIVRGVFEVSAAVP